MVYPAGNSNRAGASSLLRDSIASHTLPPQAMESGRKAIFGTMPRIAVIIPAFNEEASIERVVQEVHAVQATDLELTPVVVNDASSDNTATIAQNLDCVLLSLPVNLGIGGAVQTGLLYAHRNDFDFAVQVDGDGQHNPAHIADLLEAAAKRSLDVAIGSRFIENRGFQSTALRRFGIAYFRWLVKLLTGFRVTDTTSGFRLMNRKTVGILAHHYPDDYPEPEAFLIYARHQLKVGEVAVEMRERLGGHSSIEALGPLYYMVKVSIAVWFAAVRR